MKKNQKTLKGITPVALVNGTLLMAFAVLLVFYVFGVNSIAAGNYRISILQNKLASVTEQNGSLLADKLAMESSPAIKEFATGRGMTEAVSIFHVFENKDVAFGNGAAAN